MRKSLAERVVHCEGYPLWVDGDDEPVSPTGMGAKTTRGQVRVYMDAIERGFRIRDACAMAGFDYGTFMNIARRYPDVMREFTVAQETAAYVDEENAVEVLEEASPETAQLSNYLSLAYRWRAGVRNRKRYGEHREVEVNVRTGVVVIPSESWGTEAGLRELPADGEVSDVTRSGSDP